jgi:8-oxo-dGTP diphosphatase
MADSSDADAVAPAPGPRDPLRGDLAEGHTPRCYVVSAAVYLERDNQILLLERAEGGAMAGQWFLPGGMVEAHELPEEGARRELEEETGLTVEGDLELVGAYPMHIYGRDTLQLTYRGRAGAGEPRVSAEHRAARWVDPWQMRALLTDETIEAIAEGRAQVRTMVEHIRVDLDRYLQRIAR